MNGAGNGARCPKKTRDDTELKAHNTQTCRPEGAKWKTRKVLLNLRDEKQKLKLMYTR